MSLNKETLDSIKKTFKREMGMSYEVFKNLDFNTQQRLLVEHRRRQKKYKRDSANIVNRFGSIAKTGITLEEEQQILEENLDNIIYGKPVAFIKKLQRKFKK